jgi:hypothetical protein
MPLIPLFHDVARCFARGAAHKTTPPLPWPSCSPAHPDRLLPYTSLGRGERSSQFVLFRYLESKNYFAVGEHPINGGRKSADFLVSTSTADPIAHIEGKHLSVLRPTEN